MKEIKHRSNSFGYRTIEEASNRCFEKSKLYPGNTWCVWHKDGVINVSNYKPDDGVLIQEYKNGKDITYLKNQLTINSKS